MLGAVAGAFLLKFVIPGGRLRRRAAPARRRSVPTSRSARAILIEAILTFFLVFAVFGTAVDDRGPFDKTAGFTIGLMIAFDILACGPFTGAAMNPARWFGPALVGRHLGRLVGAGSSARSPAASSPASLYWTVFLAGRNRHAVPP